MLDSHCPCSRSSLFMGAGEKQAEDQGWLVEQRYRAVLEVLDGSPVSEVAIRYGVSRQSVYSWKARHAAAGVDGLREVSRRPRTSPSRLAADTEALVCELRRGAPPGGGPGRAVGGGCPADRVRGGTARPGTARRARRTHLGHPTAPGRAPARS